MNTDFIKWLCEKADGFEWISDEQIDMPDGSYFSDADYFLGNGGRDVYYPFLLQRAIEGVNMEHYGYFFKLNCEAIVAYPHLRLTKVEETLSKSFAYSLYNSIDQTKEAALMWVWEKEQNK